MADFAPIADSARRFAAAHHIDHTPHGWPGDTLATDSPAADGPPEPEEEDGPEPPLDDEPPDEDAPDAPQEAAPREADEILDPEQLVPASAILARVEALPAVLAANARSQELVTAAGQVARIVTADDRQQADALRDQLKAHEGAIDTFIGGACEAANKLHKGFTGLRSWMKGDLAIAAKRLGDGIAASIRAEQEAEAARQRAERQKALEEERARLKAEAEAAERERLRLEKEAGAKIETAADAAAALFEQARQMEQVRQEAEQEAATVTAPPVAAQEIAKPAGASTRDNWQALPASAESWDDMPPKDKVALIIFVGQRLAAGDGSFIHLLDVSKKACNQLAKAQKSTMKVPGIRAVNPPVYSKTSRGQ